MKTLIYMIMLVLALIIDRNFDILLLSIVLGFAFIILTLEQIYEELKDFIKLSKSKEEIK